MVRKDGVCYFVPGLPEEVSDEYLRDHFSRFGEVKDAAVVKEKGTDISRGFGYVTMADASTQEAILAEGHDFGGKIVTVMLTKDSLAGHDVKKIHLGDLRQDITAEQIREVFQQFGVVLDVHTPKDPATGDRRNFGFVTFSSSKAYDDALAVGTVDVAGCSVTIAPSAQGQKGGLDLHGAKGGKGKDAMAGKGVWGAFYDPWSGMDWGAEAHAAPAASASDRKKHEGIRYFVPALSERVTNDDLRAHFAKFGNLIDAAVVMEKGTDISRGFGYVTMADAEGQEELLNTRHEFYGIACSVMLTKDSLAGNEIKKVHLGDVGSDISGDMIREVFAQYGLILDVHTPKDPRTGERKNFAFVTFATDEGMNAALAAGQVSIGGYDIPVRAAAQTRGEYDANKGAAKGKGADAWAMDPWSAKGGWGMDKGWAAKGAAAEGGMWVCKGKGKDGFGKGKEAFASPYGYAGKGGWDAGWDAGWKGKGGFDKGGWDGFGAKGEGYAGKGFKGDGFGAKGPWGFKGKGWDGPYGAEGFVGGKKGAGKQPMVAW